MTVSNNSLVINFNTLVGFNRETCNKDCEFLFGASISNDKVAFFRPSTDRIFVKAVTALEVAVIIKLHGMEQKWSVLIRQVPIEGISLRTSSERGA